MGSRVDVGGNTSQPISNTGSILEVRQSNSASLEVTKVASLVSSRVDVGSDPSDTIGNAGSVLEVGEPDPASLKVFEITTLVGSTTKRINLANASKVVSRGADSRVNIASDTGGTINNADSVVDLLETRAT